MALSTDKNDLRKMIIKQKENLHRIKSKVNDLKLEERIIENKIAMLERLLVNKE